MAAGKRRRSSVKGDVAAEPTEPGKRIWRWWQNEKDGPKRCLEEFNELPVEARAQLTERIDRYLSRTTRAQDVTKLGNDLLELRTRIGSNQYRILITCVGRYVVGLTAFYKNTQKLSQDDLKLAKKRAARWKLVFVDPPKKT